MSRFLFLLTLMLTFTFLIPVAACDDFSDLTDAQKAAGWKLLFDGKNYDCWRGFKQKSMPAKGWVIDQGAMKVEAGQGGGDIITKDQFSDFDLRLDWKVSKGANSGIMYMVSEDHQAAWHSGPEFQILDDAAHSVSPMSKNSSGALYALYSPPAHKISKPTGDWNSSRIVISNNIVQHWLNGVLVVECERNSNDWNKRKKASKFANYAKFGGYNSGRIALQDHGNTVWFKNVRIRDLSKKKSAKEISLFNGKNMDGWNWFTKYGGRIENVWSVKDGVMICRGYPNGYIQTEKEYTNFVLKLQWRWNPITRKEGNSGVLLRKIDEDKIWPHCVEAQLHSKSAGDFWIIGKNSIKTHKDRTRKVNEKMTNAKKSHCTENRIGEWNEYEIIVDKGNITLIVNGEVLNSGSNADIVAGKICLQSEGTEIHFRNITVTPLD